MHWREVKAKPERLEIAKSGGWREGSFLHLPGLASYPPSKYSGSGRGERECPLPPLQRTPRADNCTNAEWWLLMANSETYRFFSQKRKEGLRKAEERLPFKPEHMDWRPQVMWPPCVWFWANHWASLRTRFVRSKMWIIKPDFFNLFMMRIRWKKM